MSKVKMGGKTEVDFIHNFKVRLHRRAARPACRGQWIHCGSREAARAAPRRC